MNMYQTAIQGFTIILQVHSLQCKYECCWSLGDSFCLSLGDPYSSIPHIVQLPSTQSSPARTLPNQQIPNTQQVIKRVQ